MKYLFVLSLLLLGCDDPFDDRAVTKITCYDKTGDITLKVPAGRHTFRFLNGGPSVKCVIEKVN